MSDIKLNNISKSFGPVDVLHGVDIDIKDGEFVVFVGPSGCGKSTLLRLIAGLEDITSGDLQIGGKRVNDLPPPERGIAMVFQSYALYPHMSVYKNMAFGLKIAREGKQEIDRRVRNAAQILQLEELLDRKPAQLSGGQRQRVAIGRAIVRDPDVFLFDEPLSNLDAALRVQTRLEIAKLHENLKNTVIYVTHDQVEAMTLADKIVVLQDGNVEQVGSPMDLYHCPANTFVAGFIGSPKMNFLDATVDHIDGSLAEVTLEGGQTNKIPTGGKSLDVGQSIIIGIRPEHFLSSSDDAEGGFSLSGTADVVERLGDVSYHYVVLGSGKQIIVSHTGTSDISAGQKMSCPVNPEHLHIFASDGKAL
jgi:ABC-type sugar transport system ATPase subunit